MRTKVFAYKGMVGIQSDYEAEGLLNNPKEKDQLGFVVKADYVDIQPAALKILRMIHLGEGDVGNVDIFESTEGVIFSWMGGPRVMLNPAMVTGSSQYKPELIKRSVKFQTPEDFMRFIDKHNVPKKKEDKK